MKQMKESRDKELQDLGIHLPLVGLPFEGGTDLMSEDIFRESEIEDVFSSYSRDLPYTVDASYFDQLKPLPHSRSLSFYLKPLAIASSIIIIIGVSWMNFKDHSVNNELATINTQEVIEYASVNADEFDLESLIAYAPNEEDLIEINENELQEFINENEI
jgi:hypothetical protein